MFGIDASEQPWAHCPTCYYPYGRQDIGMACCVCGDAVVLNEERAEYESENDLDEEE